LPNDVLAVLFNELCDVVAPRRPRGSQTIESVGSYKLDSGRAASLGIDAS
jgi:hypothetical protein